MDIKLVEELVKVLKINGLSSLSVSEGDMTIEIKSENSTPVSYVVPVKEDDLVETAGPEYLIQKSPAIGTVYLAPTDGEKPFVKAGDRVTKGQTLCVIEAMKLFSDYVSEFDGLIKEICVNNGDTVTVGQPMFLFLGE